MANDYKDLRDWMPRPDVRAAVARQSEPEEEEDIPFELIEVAGRVYTLPEPEEPPEQLAMQLDTPEGRAGAGAEGWGSALGNWRG